MSRTSKKRKPQQTWKVEHEGREATVYGYLEGDQYTAECPSLELSLQGTDVAATREKLAIAIRQRLAAIWEPYIEIHAAGHRKADYQGRHVSLDFRFIAVAKLKPDLPDAERTHPDDPARLLCFLHRCVTPKGEPDFMNDGVNRGLPRTIIRDTPAARAALGEIAGALEQLETRLRKLMEPGAAAANLEAIASGLRMLPAAAGDRP